jgi:hypothetical protein
MTSMCPAGPYAITLRKGCLKKSDSSLSDVDSIMKKVFFDEIMIREYPLILGDNPAVYVPK